MEQVAPLSSHFDSMRFDVGGGKNRDFDADRSFVLPAPSFREDQVITDSDITETIIDSIDGNGKRYVLLRDGYEANIEEVEHNRHRILELAYIERGQN